MKTAGEAAGDRAARATGGVCCGDVGWTPCVVLPSYCQDLNGHQSNVVCKRRVQKKPEDDAEMPRRT